MGRHVAIAIGACALLVLAAGLLLSGCRRDDWCESANDCVEADESGFDLIWTCVEETCEASPCDGSQDCELLNHCQTLPAVSEDFPPERFCAEGCGNDDDCPAGYFCRNGECEAKPCRNGHLDCDLAEVCQGGVCVEAGFPFCNECQPQGNIFDYGDDLDACDTRALGHTFCGDGNYCWNLPGGPSCGTPCDVNADCPGGFSCGQALMYASGCPGDVVVVGKFCVSDHCFNPY
jgi:hypothetical protein